MAKLKEYIFYPLILTVAVFALYHNVMNNEFSGLDDYLIIEENWDKLTDISHIYTAFTDDVFLSAQGTYYRPLLLVSYMPDVYFTSSSEPDPHVFFVFNIFLFTLSTILIYFFLREFKFSSTYRLIFVLLYISHPALTPAVAWIPGRNDLILLLCVIPSIWAFIKYFKTHKLIWGLIHLLFFALAMFSKETAIVIPVIAVSFILFYSSIFDQPIAINSWKTFIHNKLWSNIITRIYSWLKNNIWVGFGWVLVLLFWFTLRTIALPDNPFTLLGLGWQLATSWIELFIMIGAIFIPYNLPVYLEITPIHLLMALPGVVLIIYLLKKIKATPNFIFLGIFWFFLFAIPSTLSDLVVFHRLTIPLIGMAFLLSPLDQIKSLRTKKLTIGIISLFAIFFILENIHFQKAYSKTISFWHNAKQYSPNNAMAYSGLAWYYHWQHQNDSAYYYYQQVVEHDPNKENARMGMAIIIEEEGDVSTADSLLQEELKISQDSNYVYFYIGQILLERGDTTASVKNLQLGYPVTHYSRYARLYYDTLNINVKNKLDLTTD